MVITHAANILECVGKKKKKKHFLHITFPSLSFFERPHILSLVMLCYRWDVVMGFAAFFLIIGVIQKLK